MSRPPTVTFAEVDYALRRPGFEVSRSVGATFSYRHADGRGTTVPKHGSRDIAPPLVREILRESAVDTEEFIAALRG